MGCPLKLLLLLIVFSLWKNQITIKREIHQGNPALKKFYRTLLLFNDDSQIGCFCQLNIFVNFKEIG